MEPLLEAQDLVRFFGPRCAVRDLSLRLCPGEVLGLLGLNGAGKSTTLQMLTGNLAPSAGCIRIDGIDLLRDPRRAKARLGYLPEHPPVYPELTLDEYLRFCARLRGVTRQRVAAAVDSVKERCGLVTVGRRLLGTLSKGYQQRAGIAQAIVHGPSLVILDEPTSGLDPIQIREIRTLIQQLAADRALILSTHTLPEVQTICTRVHILHHGRSVFADELCRIDASAQLELTLTLEQPPPREELSALPGIGTVEQIGPRRFRLGATRDPDRRSEIARAAVDRGWGLQELAVEGQRLEQIFVDLTAGEERR